MNMRLSRLLFLSFFLVTSAFSATIIDNNINKLPIEKQTMTAETPEGIPMEKPSKNDQAPSKEQVLWTSTHLAYELELENSYIGPTSTSFGGGQKRDITTTYNSVHNNFTTRTFMAFLFTGGVEYDRYGFSGYSGIPVPDSLQALTFPGAIDFRWSNKDMMRVQAVPGFYSDADPMRMSTLNIPYAVAYSRIFSKKFQIGLGVSVNPLRSQRILGGGGFRWQITDRLKLKFLMPRPQIEYRVSKSVHVRAESDFRGDTYRVGPNFGTEHGNPSLNNAIIDYQEIRLGGGFSWNIKPLLELRMDGGMLMDRKFNYHNNDVRSTSGKSPYVMVYIRYMFHIVEDKRSIKRQINDLEDELPWLRRSIRANR